MSQTQLSSQTAPAAIEEIINLNPVLQILYAGESEWKPYQEDLLYGDSIQIKVTLNNNKEESLDNILYLGDLQLVQVEHRSKNGTSKSQAGSLLKPKERQLKTGLILNKIGNSAQVLLTLSPGQSEVKLLVISPFLEAYRPKIKLYPKNLWDAQIFKERSQKVPIQGIILGAILILCIYHLLIFFQRWDKAFLLYALYTMGIAVVIWAETGLLQIYLFPHWPYLHRFMEETQIHSLFTAVFYLWFAQEFVQLERLLPRMNTFLNRYIWILLASGVLLAMIYGFTLNPYLIKLVYLFTFSLMIVAPTYLVAIFLKRNTIANYFVAGSAFLVLGVLVNTIVAGLNAAGLIKQLNFEPALLVEAGVLIEIIIFALGLGYRQRLQEQEQRRIEELDQLKTKFFANISHEFRTPLTVIMGLNAQIKGHTKEKKLIQRNSKHLLQLVTQLLDLSKLDAGSLQLQMIQADIVRFLQYLTESFSSLAEQKGIQLVFYTEEPSLLMDFDEEKIQHIIYNLLSNAIKYTSEGGKVILHLKKQEGKHESLNILVNDTGQGIPEQDLAHVFDRFYQSAQNQNSNELSTGIGLALSKELVQLLEGTIEVKSQIDKGSTFSVLLPIRNVAPIGTPQLEIADLQIAAITEQQEPAQNTTVHLEESPLLLLIEDNADVATYIQLLLGKSYEIQVARDGQEGIDKALENLPDLIISDVMMPKKNGYEVCASLKKDMRTSHIPIILLTAKSAAEDRIEGLKVGADAYLSKPFNKMELMIRLEKLLELRQALQNKYKSWEPSKVEEKRVGPEDAFLQKMREVVEKRLNDPALGVVHLCKAANLSNMQVNRKLKALTGRTPSLFIRFIRLKKAKALLKNPELNISEIAYDVGFSDPNYFSRAFSEEFGAPPSAFR